jgi:hypothetical protein
LVGLWYSRVYIFRVRLIKRNAGRRPVRLKWYKNQYQRRHSRATARIWPFWSDAAAQVYVAATAGARHIPPHEQQRRTKRYMWVSMACAARATRLNGAHCAGARASCSLNRRQARSRASVPPLAPCAPPCRAPADFHCASRRKGLGAAAPRRQKRCKALRSAASHR